MIGRTLGHYRILEQVGAGGMGVVYRAHDERLDRDVALKVLAPGSLADEAARARFRQEALALARLSHANIGVIHDFDTDEGVDYLVMEFVAGAPLDSMIPAGGMPAKTTAALGVQIAAALDEAHEHGIVHRDLKPGNILVTFKGTAKVLDFGLAKVLRPDSESAATVTLSRAVAGTMPYMAPEQLRGDVVDARTDLFAFGAVLYEMATGQRPFQADTSAGLIEAILREAPPAPARLNPKISPDLERVLLKCLEKEPENRYQTAKDIAVDLRRVASPSGTAPVPIPARTRSRTLGAWVGSAAALVVILGSLVAFDVGGVRHWLLDRGRAEIHSVAVLPLENLSRDPEQEYFADGMTEALIAELSRIRALKVISRTSVMQFKGTKQPLPDIARALGVDAVIEGSVLREGDEVRITVQLIHAGTDAHLWAESYVRELKGILSLQGEVAQTIAKEVRATVTPEEAARLSNRRDVDPEAHILVLRGRQLLGQVGTTPEGIEQAITLFQQAIRRDPESAPAYAGLAAALIGKSGAGYAPMLEAAPLALNAAEKAISLDTTLGEAFAARAAARFMGEWNWARAEQDFLDALALSPNSAPVLDSRAEFLMCVRRLDEGVDVGRRAVESDPLNTGVSVRQAYRLLLAGRTDEALAAIRHVLTLNQDDLFAKWMLGVILSQRGEYDEAIATFLSRKVPTADTNWALGYTYARTGKKEEARRIVDFLVRRRNERYVWPAIIAHIYVALDERDKAFEYLELAFRERDYQMRVLQVDPRFDSLRSDPRFQDLMRRMNFPKEDARSRRTLMSRRVGLVLCLFGFLALPGNRPVSIRAQAPPAAVTPARAEVPRAIRRDVPLTNAIRRAFAAGTRDTTGRPGPNYWQLQTDYTISARLDPNTQTITGTETITLHNNSPQALHDILLRLDHNIFRALVPRGASVPAEVTDGMVVTRLVVNGETVDLAAPSAPDGRRAAPGPRRLAASDLDQTLARVTLVSPIAAKSSATLEVGWHTKLPGGPGGRGHRMTQRFDDILFQPTQWFPRVAKFDDLNGWDTNVYLGPSEFYNNFGRFDVRMEVPSGWIVSGTGVLQNPQEVLTATARDRLSHVVESDEVVTIVSGDEVGPGQSTAPGDRLVWHFVADMVNDFAWATARTFVWRATRATIPGKGPIPIHMVYLPDRAKLFVNAGPVARHALEFYSKLWAPYPFPQLTLQDGPSSGMEYPMVINSNQGAADHEAGHQWWPMMVGTNETRYGWMDEGFDSYMNILSRADARGVAPSLDQLGQSYGQVSGNEDEPTLMWNANYAGSMYRVQTYSKAPMMLSMLGGIVGDAAVQRAMSEYTKTWAFKHPSPWDFVFFMTTALGQDLGWFWYYWLWTNESVDGSIANVTTRGSRTMVTVRQDGQMPSPIVLKVTFAPTGAAIGPMANARMENETTAIVTWPADVWFGGSGTFEATLDFGERPIVGITLDPGGRFPDRIPQDNVWPRGTAKDQ